MRYKFLVPLTVVFSGALASFQSSEEIYIPKTADEALANLHITEAGGHTWSGYGVGSYALYRVRVSREGGETASYTMRRVVESRSDQSAVITDIAQLPGGTRKDTVTQFEDRPNLAPSKAKRLADEDVSIGPNTYKTKVYEFTAMEPDEEGRGLQSWRYDYWLTGGVPDGVVKIHVVTDENNPARKREVDAHLTESTALKVGGTKLSCYCREIVAKNPDGTSDRVTECRNKSVPGYVVRAERVTSDGSRVIERRIDTLTRYAVTHDQ